MEIREYNYSVWGSQPKREFIETLRMGVGEPDTERQIGGIYLEGEWDVVKAIYIVSGADWRSANKKFFQAQQPEILNLTIGDLNPNLSRRVKETFGETEGPMKEILSDVFGHEKTILGSAAQKMRHHFDGEGIVDKMVEEAVKGLRSDKRSYYRRFDYDGWGTSLFKTTVSAHRLENLVKIDGIDCHYGFHAYSTEPGVDTMFYLAGQFPLAPSLDEVRITIPLEQFALRGDIHTSKDASVRKVLVDWGQISGLLDPVAQTPLDIETLLESFKSEGSDIYRSGLEVGETEYGTRVAIGLSGVVPMSKATHEWTKYFIDGNKMIAPVQFARTNYGANFKPTILGITLRQSKSDGMSRRIQEQVRNSVDQIVSNVNLIKK